MSDPFMAAEQKLEKTKGVLDILAEYDYPCLISTKASIRHLRHALNILKVSNIEVRISLSTLPEQIRCNVDKGCPSLQETLDCLSLLRENGIIASVRLQPLFPGYECYARDLIRAVGRRGVEHISIEYLKAPRELHSAHRLWASLPEIYVKKWKSEFNVIDGRELKLSINYRLKRLLKLKEYANNLGLSVGLADNELLPYSDFSSCCNSSARLRRAQPFLSNYPAIIRMKKIGETISIQDLESCWIPRKSIGTYLNSRTRDNGKSASNDWIGYLNRSWSGGSGIYSPDFYCGVDCIDRDEKGNNIYVKRGLM